MLNHPPKRYAFEISKKKRRPHRRYSAAQIADEEDEERGVQTGVAIFVRSNPGANEKHRRAGRAENVPGDCSEKKQRTIKKWSRFSPGIPPATTKREPTTAMKEM